MTYHGICEKCGKPVDASKYEIPAWPVTGWEVQRSAGGANVIHGRERIPNRVRHKECLPKNGISDDQDTLL